MRPITKTVYAAFDGTEHDTAEAARAHEKANAHLAIVGLTVEEALAIVNRENAERADAVERIGRLIGRKRLEGGERRRHPRPKAPEPEPEPGPVEDPTPRSTIPVTSVPQPWPWPNAANPAETEDDAGSEADALTA